MNNINVLVMGDMNIDLIMKNLSHVPEQGKEEFVEDIEMCVGGSAANTAIGLAKLGVKVGIFGVLGKDLISDYIIDYFGKVGVYTGLIKFRDNKSGLSIALRSNKDRSFISYTGTNSLYNPLDIKAESLNGVKHVHFSGFNWGKNTDNYIQAAKYIKEQGCSTSLDVGWTDFSKWGIGIFKLLKYIDIFFPNEDEAMALTDTDNVRDAIEKLSSKVQIVIVTLGSKGAVACSNKIIYKCDALKVEVVDTVGAGDSFDAGFIYSYLKNNGIQKSLQIGCACGSYTSTGYGGGVSNPDLDMLNELVSTCGII